MPVDIGTIVTGISAIPPVINALKKAISTIGEKTGEKEVILDAASRVQEIDNNLNMIKDGAWSINAYFVLYGHALDLYTTGDDFTKTILRLPDEVATKKLIAATNYENLLQKFNEGITPFLTAYSGYIDKEDEGEIRTHINKIRELIGEGNVYLKGEEYEKLEGVINELTRTSNILRGMSRGRLLSLIMELQKVGGA